MKTKTFELEKTVSKLNIAVPFDVRWVVSKQRKVEIVTDNPEMLNLIQIIQGRNMLEISNAGSFVIGKCFTSSGVNVIGNNNVFVGGNNTGNINRGNISIGQNHGMVAGTFVNQRPILAEVIGITVYAPSFNEITLSGAGSLTASLIQQQQLSVELSGASTIKLAGDVAELVADVSGAGNLKAKRLKAKTAKLSVSGAGSMKAQVDEAVYADIIGAGSIRIYGRPETVIKQISGTGSIKLKGG